MPTYTNDFRPWAISIGANVLTPADYAAAIIRQQGAQQGIADPTTYNTAQRQASEIATIIAQFTADWGPGNVLDNGDLAALEAQFIAALTRLIGVVVGPAARTSLYYGGPDTGVANAYVYASPNPAITSYVEGMAILIGAAHNNTGASTAAFSGLGAVTMTRLDGSALQPLDIETTGIYLLVYNAGGQFTVLNLMPPVSAVPVATTTSNGIAREATPAEAAAATTTGSVPAFVTPEDLAGYQSVKWTEVTRSASHTETAFNEFIVITGSANFTIGLVPPTGRNGAAYRVVNLSSANQNLTVATGGFQGNSDDGSGTFTVIPPGGDAFLFSDGTNYLLTAYNLASVLRRGAIRVANSVEAFNATTSGSAPAAMTPEDVAIYLAGQIATTVSRGISREATLAECNAGVTTGSVPAFVPPEGLADFATTQGLYNPFITTGIGAVIVATTHEVGNAATALVGRTCSWGGTPTGFYNEIGVNSSDPDFGGFDCRTVDYRWQTSGSAPAGTWKIVSIENIPVGSSIDATMPVVLLRIA